MKEFFKRNRNFILVGIVGAIVGALLQYMANLISNEKLKKELIAELTILLDKNKTGRVTTDEQKRITELQAQLNILNR